MNKKLLVYRDQNVTDAISKCDIKGRKVDEIINLSPNQQIELLFTPFSLMEFSGVKTKDLCNEPGENFSINKSSEFDGLFMKACNFYKNKLKRNYKEIFLEGIEKQKPYKTSQRGRELIDNYIHYTNNRINEEVLTNTLIIDRISSLDYALLVNKCRDIHLRLMGSAKKHLKLSQEFNMVRLVHKAAECTPGLSPQFQQRLKEISYHSASDLLDTSITHYACFGHKGQSVTILTTDDKETVFDRISLHKSLLEAKFSGSLKLQEDFEIYFLEKENFDVIERVDMARIQSTQQKARDSLISHPIER